MERPSFSEWAKQRLSEIDAEKLALPKWAIPPGDPRWHGFHQSYNICKYHHIDTVLVAKAVQDGHIEGYIVGSQLWVNRDDFHAYFNL